MLIGEVIAPSVGTIIGVGLGTVFFGLICIIVLISLVGRIIRPFEKKEKEASEPTAESPVQNDEIPNRGEFVAAVAAAIAEDLGTDVSKIRICSVRKL